MHDLEDLLTDHAPIADQLRRYKRLRDAAKVFVQAVLDENPRADVIDQSVAIRKIREAAMTANAAIACGEASAPSTAKAPEPPPARFVAVASKTTECYVVLDQQGCPRLCFSTLERAQAAAQRVGGSIVLIPGELGELEES